jgi:hypothetical protein
MQIRLPGQLSWAFLMHQHGSDGPNLPSMINDYRCYHFSLSLRQD